MDKKEFKTRANEIISKIEEFSKDAIKYDKPIFDNAKKRFEDIDDFIEEEFTGLDSFCLEDILQEILESWFKYNEDILDILKDIDYIKCEVVHKIISLRGYDTPEEENEWMYWKQIKEGLRFIEDFIDIEENDMQDVDDFINGLTKIKEDLYYLIENLGNED